MASPQKENGFTPIANDIVEALARTSLSDRESRVLMVILRRTYGWNQKCDRISLSQFSDATGILKEHCGRTLQRLVLRKIVAQTGNRWSPKYEIQKDYDKWLPKPATLPKPASRVARTGIEKVARTGIANNKRQSKAITKRQADALSIFNYYLSKKLKQHRRFDSWKSKIQARLKKYSIQELKTCINKLADSSWHRENGFTGLEQIVDSDQRVENWLVRTTDSQSDSVNPDDNRPVSWGDAQADAFME